jgi:hypothetical protein
MLSPFGSAGWVSCWPLHVAFNVARPGRRSLHTLPAGSALIFVQDVAATISVIANTGVMLDIGQERSMK